jgi:tetratricopeptide (TPR) repeat protein
MFELKRLSVEALPAALEKADRYRLLGEPLEAECICRDVLEVDPQNRVAKITLILALSEQLQRRLAEKYNQAHELVQGLGDEYTRAYYEGLLCERRAKVVLDRNDVGSGSEAYAWFRQAMEHLERAIELRPAGNDDPILRWNTCARILNRHPDLKPEPETRVSDMLE